MGELIGLNGNRLFSKDEENKIQHEVKAKAELISNFISAYKILCDYKETHGTTDKEQGTVQIGSITAHGQLYNMFVVISPVLKKKKDS